MKIKFFLVIFFFITFPAFANDGFYQGGGSNVYPVHNKSLRVLSEKLVIQPVEKSLCYKLLIDGQIVDYNYYEKKKLRFNSTATFARIGPAYKCTETSSIRTNLEPKWHAVAEYEIEAIDDQKKIKMGFPIFTWEPEFLDIDGLTDVLPAPSVVNFKTYKNNISIKYVKLEWVNETSSKNKEEKTLAYTWRSSFEKNKKYTLKTEYDFGQNYSSSFYSGREYLKDEMPWFLKSNNEQRPAFSIFYYLTPIRFWAQPPPSSILIKISIPPKIPVTYAVPTYIKPSCVDLHAFFFKIKNKFPENELNVTFPNYSDLKNYEDLNPISSKEELKMWKRTLGNEFKLTCSLVKELMKNIKAIDLRNEFAKIVCVESCQ